MTKNSTKNSKRYGKRMINSILTLSNEKWLETNNLSRSDIVNAGINMLKRLNSRELWEEMLAVATERAQDKVQIHKQELKKGLMKR